MSFQSNLLDLNLYREMRSKVPITSAIVNVTDMCNLRCHYCFTCQNGRISSVEIMKKTIDFLIQEVERVKSNGIPESEIPSLGLTFFGGEPMLFFDEIIKPTVIWANEEGIVKKYKLGFSITTNGTLLNEERIKFLRKYNVNILLSIDGDKETQDDQRPAANGKSSFDLIKNNIPILLRYFPETTFRSTLEPRNAKKLLENYIFARNCGFKHYFVTPNVYAEWRPEDIATALTALGAIGEVMMDDIKNGEIPCRFDPLDKSFRECFLNNKGEFHIDLKRCGIGTVSMGVACNGDIKGCQEHNTYTDNENDLFYIGDIFNGINEDLHRSLLGNYTSVEIPYCKEDPSICEKCEIRDICATNFCPSANMGKNKNTVEMPYISCVWKNFLHQMALILLEKISIEGMDENTKNYLFKLF